MREILKVRDLQFGYVSNDLVIDGLSFSLEAGEVCAFLGENGCGKTTLIDLLLGLQKPQSGSIKILRSAGLVPQKFSVPFNFSCEEIALMGRARSISPFATPGPNDYKAVRQAFRELGIEALLHKNFSELSGGQQQMVLIARALAGDSDLIFLDEPASALDLKNQDKMLFLLKQLSKNKGKTIVFTTHHPNHALAAADKVLLMKRGHYIFGSRPEVLTEENLTTLFGLPVVYRPISFQTYCLGEFATVFSSQLEELQKKNAPKKERLANRKY